MNTVIKWLTFHQQIFNKKEILCYATKNFSNLKTTACIKQINNQDFG